ncbi:hypothetical protein NMY22_g7128 [Coprinellus aureogranulatus]|nr:hypothetical protein NMY22_g7128 [Coprinellus aureogranulatus]
MVSKITMSRKRARTADYIGRNTNRGYKGRVVREGTRHRKEKSDQPALQPPPKLHALKRPRIDEYSPQRPVPLSPAVMSEEEHDQPQDNIPTLEDIDESPAYRPKLLETPDGKHRHGPTSHEYLSEWEKTKVSSYLSRIVQAEALQSPTCSGCGESCVQWRCLECVGRPQLCTDCCRVSHRSNPLHRIERWTGDHWQPASLWQVGTVVCLGHGSGPCPKYDASLSRLEQRLDIRERH